MKAIVIKFKEVAGDSISVFMRDLRSESEVTADCEVTHSTPKTVTVGSPINRTFYRSGKQQAPHNSDYYHRVSYKLIKVADNDC